MNNSYQDSHFFLSCDPTQRIFPKEWKNTYFRTHGFENKNGEYVYQCPICKKDFDHTKLDCLFSDHIWPYSLMGDTKWNNYQLLCGLCNMKKKDFINKELRKVLGEGSFRESVLCYIKNHVDKLYIPHGMTLSAYISIKE